MEPKRLRFSDLSSDSESRSSMSSSHSHSLSGSDDYVLRLSTSFTSVSTSSDTGKHVGNGDFHFLHPNPPRLHSTTDPSRHSGATTASGTTVWTVHGSTRTTMGVGMPPSSARSDESTEKTERIDQDAVKLRRRTVATVSSNDSGHAEERSPTPTAALFNSISPTVPIQRKVVVSIADDTEELPPTQPSGPLKEVVAFVEVFSGADDRSALIGNALRDLGATVCQRLTNKVTHVVFREGRQATLERARSRNVFLVTVLWVEACERENSRVSESAFAIGRREKGTPSLARERRFRSMQPRPMEAELALTDDRIRKRKQRLEASKQKRELRKEIREGLLAAASSTIERSGRSVTSTTQTPATVVPLVTRSVTDTGRWMSGEEDDTPESLRRQVADVRKKILGPTDTPNSRRESSMIENETLAESIRKKLFDNDEGKLHGTPVPTFLDRPKRITRSATSGISHDGSRIAPTPATAQIGKRTTDASKIDEIMTNVCDKVTNMALQCKAPPQSAKRRIFNRNCERISDGMMSTPDLSGQEGPSKLLSLTARAASNQSSVDIGDIFGIGPSVGKGGKAKANSKKGKSKTEMVRLRSSLFQVKSTSDIIRELQTGRRSSEDFRSPLHALTQPKRAKTKASTRKQEPSKNSATPSPTKRKSKSRRLESFPGLVMTNVKQEDRELIYAIVKRMKGFRVQNKVTSDTTHVICGESKRTLNVLMGVARGCWMLPIEWVYHSLANGEWLSEEQFELADQFPAARSIRKEEKAASLDAEFSPTCRIFNGLGPFYIAPSSQPPATDLCSLIRWCGGKVALTSKRAAFCVGCPATHEDAVGVTETWILDSIMEYRLVAIDKYLIK